MTNKVLSSLSLILSSLILCIGAASSVSAQGGTLSGVVRIHKSFGVIPRGSGHTEPGSPCGQIYIALLDPDNRNRPIVVESTDAGRDQGEFYTCRATLKAPPNKRLYAIAGMGGARLLPEIDRHPLYITDAWIGGTNNKPRRGHERGFAGKFVTLNAKRGTYLAFEMHYAQVDPN